MRVKCLNQEHNTMTHNRSNRTVRFKVYRTNLLGQEACLSRTMDNDIEQKEKDNIAAEDQFLRLMLMVKLDQKRLS